MDLLILLTIGFVAMCVLEITYRIWQKLGGDKLVDKVIERWTDGSL